MNDLKSILESGDVLALSCLEVDQAQRDDNGRTALHRAVAADATDSALWLLDNDKVAVNIADVHGETPIMRAAWLGNFTLVEALIERGADLSAQSLAGGTALHFAHGSANPSSAVLERLLDSGANPEALDGAGKRPEQWSAYGKALKEGASMGRKPARRGTLRLKR